MNYRKAFVVAPESRVHLADCDPGATDRHQNKKDARREIAKLQQRMDLLQFRLYAEQKRSLLICLQGLDAGGKDGVIRHVMASLNPQGCRVVGFKQPSPVEQAHDFLWRIEQQTPRRGEVVVFNRSHYEDVLVVRVHELVPKPVWVKRYEQINELERRLFANGTCILKFFLHISKEEQLERFKDRLEDPERQWKISETDYSERTYWNEYAAAYEDALSRCSTREAPWFVIPSNHKWFRDLTISHIIVETMEGLGIEMPSPGVNIKDIRKRYHEARERAAVKRGKAPKM